MKKRLLKKKIKKFRKYCKDNEIGFSTGICGNWTAGTGNLDELGYWEFPIIRVKKEITFLTKHFPQAMLRW